MNAASCWVRLLMVHHVIVFVFKLVFVFAFLSPHYVQVSQVVGGQVAASAHLSPCRAPPRLQDPPVARELHGLVSPQSTEGSPPVIRLRPQILLLLDFPIFSRARITCWWSSLVSEWLTWVSADLRLFDFLGRIFAPIMCGLFQHIKRPGKTKTPRTFQV